MMDGYGDYSDQDTDSPDLTREGFRVRSLLQLPPGSSTDDVLTAIQLLQFQNGKMTSIWETLTELLYLGPDTPPSDVLTTIAMYVKEAQFLKDQEQRHLFVIQKLQNDRRDILKRFHLSKPKPPTASRIRTNAQFPRKAAEAVEDLGIIDDEQDSVADGYEMRQKELQAEMRSKTNNGNVNSPLWTLLEEANGIKSKNKTATVDQSLDSNHDVPEQGKYLQGYIIPKASQKSRNPGKIRDNITTGTRESIPDKYANTSNHSEHGTSTTGNKTVHTRSKQGKLYSHSKAEEIGRAKKGFLICSEIQVTEKGGCYDIPDLGIRVSVPGGALPQGSTSERLVVGLTWDDPNVPEGGQSPVGPTLTIQPSGLPFKKPMVISLQHNVAAISQLDDFDKRLRSTNLILMQKSGLKSAEKWLPVEPDPGDPYFTPLGFIAEDNTVMFIKNAGRYMLVPSQKDILFMPNALLFLVFASYVKTDVESLMKLDIYCFEENQANKKASVHLINYSKTFFLTNSTKQKMEM